ncbi:DegT/DnrJ/EryC1/StrS family aminotransferase [Patescibacteria group bacterium]|nr:DegT/DnrJ/EryC1/StrS family aminotransferase [Patescibacteria group bacterium]
MNKPFIPVSYPDLTGGNERKYLLDCFDSSWISSKGEYIRKFEYNFAKYIGVRFGVATSNGTTALHLAISALGLGKGDEVIVPNLTFVASANVVRYTGAKPVFVDVEKETWGMDPTTVEKAITKRTKAVMPVHLYGQPAAMGKLIDIANKHNLSIIEDAAEAHGAQVRIKDQESRIKRYKWRKVGSLGKAGCFSFYGNKIITTGEGGMVVTDDEKLAQKMRILRDHGQNPKKRYYHDVVGFNYRMTNMQAAIGMAQFERIEKLIVKKREIARCYEKYLKGINGIFLAPKLHWSKSVYWMYSVLIDSPYPKTRDEMMIILQKENIETRPFFYPVSKLPPYKQSGDFAQSIYLSAHGINLPSGTTLSEDDIKRVAKVFQKYQ